MYEQIDEWHWIHFLPHLPGKRLALKEFATGLVYDDAFELNNLPSKIKTIILVIYGNKDKIR